MKPLRLLVLLIVAAKLVAAALAVELTVFAAASLSDALKELAPRYTAVSGDTLRFNFAASGTLTRQIREGAPADIIFSADELRVDQLEKAGLLRSGTRRTVLANSLVLVVNATEPSPITTPQDLTGPNVHRLAIGDPATVPAGSYAKAYFEKLSLWTQLQTKIVALDNVRAVLAAVEAGNADAGIVYKTDALFSKKVKIAYEVPLADGPKIAYPAAVIKDSKQPEAARSLVAFFASAGAQAVFAKYGFLPPPAK